MSWHVGAPGGWELGPRRTGGKFIAQLSLVDSARAGFGALTLPERPRSKACAKQAPFHLVWGYAGSTSARVALPTDRWIVRTMRG